MCGGHKIQGCCYPNYYGVGWVGFFSAIYENCPGLLSILVFSISELLNLSHHGQRGVTCMLCAVVQATAYCYCSRPVTRWAWAPFLSPLFLLWPTFSGSWPWPCAMLHTCWKHIYPAHLLFGEGFN